MYKTILFLILLISCNKTTAQSFFLKIGSENISEDKIIDSLGYKKKHQTIKEVSNENLLFAEKLLKIGYLNSKNLSFSKENDTIVSSMFSLGKRIKSIHIYIGNENEILKDVFKEKDTLEIAFEDFDNFRSNLLKKLEAKGYPMTKLSFIPEKIHKNHLTAKLEINLEQKRTINKIVFECPLKFPQTFEKNINRIYRKKIIQPETLDKLYQEIDKIDFVKQSKPPEILFTKDSTNIFVFLEKNKANTFDGFVGFTNDEKSKLSFTGYLDLSLKNILNSGEKFSIYWKNDGNKQTTFDLNFEIPYIFKTALGIKTELNIFKQDSTFQNTKTNFNIGYYFSYNSKLYLGYQKTESSDIQNLNTSTFSDFESKFATLEYTFNQSKRDEILFPIKTNFKIKTGIGNRNTKLFTDKQLFISTEISHNFYLNEKNIINLKSLNGFIDSKNYLTNELFRFGGINNVRGFNENSLQGNLFSTILTEYRYRITDNLYINSILDYGYFRDTSNSIDGKLFSFGIGAGILTKNGLLKLIYANGSTSNHNRQLKNSIVHISLSVNF